MVMGDLRSMAARLSRSGARGVRPLLAVALTAVAIVAATVAPAAAQGGGGSRFFLGPIGWTPTILLREAGIDSNVFNETAKDGAREDRYAIFQPTVDGSWSTALAELSGQAAVNLVYFERFQDQRSVNGQANFRAEFPLQRLRPTVGMSWQRNRERVTPELDQRAKYEQIGGTGSISTRLTNRLSLQLSGALTRVEYLAVTPTAIEDARRLNRRTTSVSGTFRFDISPLTLFLVDVNGSRDEFEKTSGRTSDNLRASAGLEFAPDAVLRGRATVGYHMQVSRGDSGSAFNGVMAAVDLSYALLDRTRIDLRFSRDTNYSILTGEDYYLTTAGGLEITHNLLGPLDVIARGSRERLDYTVTVGGVPGRIDMTQTVGAGIAVRFTQRLRSSVNYDETLRRSTTGAETAYDRRRLYTTFSLGF